MDDVNINEICLDNIDVDIEVVQLDGDEDDWIKLSWIIDRSDNGKNFQSSGTQKDSDNEIAQTKDNDSKVSCTNTESDDISDGISVITESDTDVVNTNLQICQFNRKPCKSPQMLEVQTNKQKDIWNTLIAYVFGIIVGVTLSYFFTILKTCPVSNGVDVESLKTASHNIVNTCKELTDVKTMLNEIKAHMPTDIKITEQILTQFIEITDSSNKTSSKPVTITKKFFNSTSYPLDQLQNSLHVLSSLSFIYDDNNSLKNDINKTLDIVNNTKAFYDTLISLMNNTQVVFDPIVLDYLQHNSDRMHIASKSLLTNLVEKVSKVILKVYNKYAKERHRLSKTLCHLKSKLPNDKLLKQLTENNQLFKDHDKFCFSNYTSKNLVSEMTAKENTKTKNIKEHIIKTDDAVLNTKYDKKYTYKIRDNDKDDSLKNKKKKRQNVDKFSTMKFLRNASHEIRNTSQLLISKVIENMNKLKYQLRKKLHHLKNILYDNKFLKQLIEDSEEDIKESVEYCKGKNDDLRLDNSFDNILAQLKNTCPLSTNFCPGFNIINMSIFDTVSTYKTKNYKYKYDTNSKRTVMDHENSAKILPAKEKNRPKKKEYFKLNGPTKNVINDDANYEKKYIPSQNKINNHISEHTVNYHMSKYSSSDSRTMKQDNQHYINTNERSDNERSYKYSKHRQPDDSDWYFRRVYSRRNARRHAKQPNDSDWYFQRVYSRNARRRAKNIYR
ncbi:PREDICTED: MATH and LRR domain-containing protein PFE0570w-like [Trachymyrmex cornetzi]|uniref:Uncharacterized protein n=1 Tax=Trachymyrmex cornetzi TaxID=471704 RepID=A0A151J8N5_9HYME|nr:PREDICTED: MATH and LRR domain-containing protein PFE0570w-like [Trachymyrmex cornetzi]KYN21223.1 hypothetical protein ALC57_06416 [Trachymyrmex cornetzi]